jgi:hypothetical protein
MRSEGRVLSRMFQTEMVCKECMFAPLQLQRLAGRALSHTWTNACLPHAAHVTDLLPTSQLSPDYDLPRLHAELLPTSSKLAYATNSEEWEQLPVSR